MVNPKAADVFIPLDVSLGLLAKAKKALKIKAIPSNKKSLFCPTALGVVNFGMNTPPIGSGIGYLLF